MNIDFETLPKTACDTVSINYKKHHFLVALTSGTDVAAFTIPPELMKAFAEGLPGKIADYEKQYGEIDPRGAEGGIQSPIQLG